MRVYSGPDGAEVECREDFTGEIPDDSRTCAEMQVHQPSDAAVALAAPVAFDCASCASDGCCSSAEVVPGTRCTGASGAVPEADSVACGPLCVDTPRSGWPSELEELATTFDINDCAAAVSGLAAIGVECDTDIATNTLVQTVAPGLTGKLVDFCCVTCQ